MKILLSCLLFLDLFVIVSCVSISVSISTLHPSQLPTDFVTMINLAILLGTYGLTSTLCNILAFYALRKNNRVFLVPYLVFLPLVLVTIVIFIVKSILSKGLTPELLFIPMAVGLVISIIWLKIMRHWFVLTPDNQILRRRSVSVDPELVRSYVQSLVVNPAPDSPQGPASPDFPPSYENLVFEPSSYPKEVTETPPPCYEEVVIEKERL
jgi:vacuolar-type H+-ATPase subunit I/STV1